MPGYLFRYAKFKALFETPMLKEGSRESLNRLQALTRPFILRRLKKEVLSELPDKVEDVAYVSLEGEQKKLYMAAALELKTMLEDRGQSFAKQRFQVLAKLTRLRQICCDLVLCYPDYKGESAKLEMCLSMVGDGVTSGHKILVFSQFASMLRIMDARIQELGIPRYLLTGSTPVAKREEMVAGFGRGEVPVFLISLKAGGVGLNLASADMVIHYDPWWNVAAQNQATDRAHRIGQKNTVMVYQMIGAGTIEENILHLQEAKKRLASQVIDGAGGWAASLTREELLELLEGAISRK